MAHLKFQQELNSYSHSTSLNLNYNWLQVWLLGTYTVTNY